MKRPAIILLLSLLFSSLLAACGLGTTLRYSVTGTSKEVSIRYVDESGETSAETVVTPPFDLELKAGNSFGFQLYVTNISGQGEIQCEVFADDKSLGDASGNTFAGCEGNYEKRGSDIRTRFTGYDDVIPDSYDAPAVKLPAGVSGMILFAGDQKEAGHRDFYIYDLSGSELIQLTEGLGRSSSCPRLSPDGSRLSFIYGGSISDLFILNLDGTGLTNLTNDAKDSIEDFCADWSPDGRQLIFSAAKEESPNDWIQQIYSAKADGSGISQLTANTNEAEDYQDPVFSPDGQKIAFISDTLAGNVYQMNADGSDFILFSDLQDSIEDFHWSPDGTKIVYACHQGIGGIGEGVCVMNGDGSGSLALTDDSSLEGIYHTAWSPDGAKIAFAARKDGVTNIYIMNPDGTDLLQLTHFNEMVPYWIIWLPSIELPRAPIPVSIGQ